MEDSYCRRYWGREGLSVVDLRRTRLVVGVQMLVLMLTRSRDVSSLHPMLVYQPLRDSHGFFDSPVLARSYY